MPGEPEPQHEPKPKPNFEPRPEPQKIKPEDPEELSQPNFPHLLTNDSPRHHLLPIEDFATKVLDGHT